MLTKEAYFKAYPGHRDITPEIEANADKLIVAVNALLADAALDGVVLKINPATGTIVGGEQNGGWRPKFCPVGAKTSSHKTGEGVDFYDNDGALDDWLLAKVGYWVYGEPNELGIKPRTWVPGMLEKHGLYMEDPAYTRAGGERKLHTEGWCHLTTRAPKSGIRVFIP